MTEADRIYRSLLGLIQFTGERISTRNSITTSSFLLPNVTFREAPIVTVKRTAIKKAIAEMEWFLSGWSKCPEGLLDWWDGQLNSEGYLLDGYAKQFRGASMEGEENGVVETFDQVKFILDGLRDSPNSRRLLISMWNPGEMANITETNNNPNTPTCCHSIVVQFFVRGNKLHMKTYQRSADMLLGVPHNWIQSWAMLMYFAHHSNLEVGSMTWMWGDAHIYEEDTHLQAVKEMLEVKETPMDTLDLIYLPEAITYDSNNVPVFKASDFTIVGTIPEPIVKHKINLMLYYKGTFPKDSIDHIDRNTTNNSIDNLRDASHSINMMNTAQQKNNSTGVKGVSLKGGKWPRYFAEVCSGSVRRVRSINIASRASKEDALHEITTWVINTRNELHKEFATHD